MRLPTRHQRQAIDHEKITLKNNPSKTDDDENSSNFLVASYIGKEKGILIALSKRKFIIKTIRLLCTKLGPFEGLIWSKKQSFPSIL